MRIIGWTVLFAVVFAIFSFFAAKWQAECLRSNTFSYCFLKLG